LTHTLPSFPMRPALPASEYYDGSAPPTAFNRQRTYPTPKIRLIPRTGTTPRMVPTFTDIRSTSEAPGFTPAALSQLRRRPSSRPAGPGMRNLPDSSPPSRPHGLKPRTTGAHRHPAHIHRIRAGQLSRGVKAPVPRVYLPVSFTRPGPSGSTRPS
jgi:hypothetical protein